MERSIAKKSVAFSVIIIMIVVTLFMPLVNDDYQANAASKKVTVKYYPNKGKFSEKKNAKKSTVSKKVTKSKNMGKAPAIKRNGYVFKGWYTKKSGGKLIKTSTKIKKDTKLYARWNVLYKVKYNPNGGVFTAKADAKKTTLQKSIEKGKKIGTLPKVSKSGYSFDGWFTAKTGGTKVTSSTKSSNMTLYARWTKVASKYNVNFDANGGDFTASQYKGKSVVQITADENTTIGSLPSVKRNGYTFDGWYTSKNAGTKVAATTKVTSNMTLYARWAKVAIKYQVNFDASGGDFTASQYKGKSVVQITADENTTMGSLPTVKKDGYTFDGWYTSKKAGTKVVATTKVTSNMTLYARWIVDINRIFSSLDDINAAGIKFDRDDEELDDIDSSDIFAVRNYYKNKVLAPFEMIFRNNGLSQYVFNEKAFLGSVIAFTDKKIAEKYPDINDFLPSDTSGMEMEEYDEIMSHFSDLLESFLSSGVDLLNVPINSFQLAFDNDDNSIYCYSGILNTLFSNYSAMDKDAFASLIGGEIITRTSTFNYLSLDGSTSSGVKYKVTLDSGTVLNVLIQADTNMIEPDAMIVIGLPSHLDIFYGEGTP